MILFAMTYANFPNFWPASEMLKNLNPILGKYMEQNNITVVIDKKNVLMGNKKYEITSQIIEILNKEFKSINLN